MRPTFGAALVITLAMVVAACSSSLDAGSAAPAGSASASVDGVTPTPGAVEAARAELDHALARLEAIHPEPFHAVDRATFVAELEALKADLDRIAPETAATELMRIWALLSTERDGHQFALPLDDETDPILPVRVYEFEEGVFVTAAMPAYEDLEGLQLIAIGDTPMAEVLERLEPLVPRDGPATVPSFRPLYLLRTTVLRGLGIVGPGPIPVSVQDGSEVRSLTLDPVPATDFRAWAGWMPFTGLAPRDGLRHTQHGDPHFRVELMADEGSVYVRYAQVQQVPGGEVAELRRLAALPEVERIIVDIRQNGGGNNFTYPSVVSALSDAAIDQPGRLVVLTDRITFSAASNFATVVEQGTSAVFAGESMGGGLNFWNDVDWIELPDFVIPMRVAISTRYWQKSTPDDPRLTIEPDLLQPVRAADYFAGRDPLLEAVLYGAAG